MIKLTQTKQFCLGCVFGFHKEEYKSYWPWFRDYLENSRKQKGKKLENDNKIYDIK